MSAEITCDGCGKKEPMVAGRMGTWHKPSVWFERSDEKGIQSACSRECIDKIAQKTGATRVVAPF